MCDAETNAEGDQHTQADIYQPTHTDLCEAMFHCIAQTNREHVFSANDLSSKMHAISYWFIDN